MTHTHSLRLELSNLLYPSTTDALNTACSVNGLLLEGGRDGLHDFLSLDLVVDLKGEQVSGGSQLELCDAVSLVLLDSDLLSAGQALLLSTHDLDELLQILDFLGLYMSG